MVSVQKKRVFVRRLMGVALVALVLVVAGEGLARAAKSEVLVANGVLVLLQDRMPAEASPPGRIAVKQEVWDAPRIAQAFGQGVVPVELPGNVGHAGEGDWLRLDKGDLVRLGAAGAGFYITSNDSGEASASPDPSYDASSAVEIASGYVREHGGLPCDAELWSVREVLAVELSLDDDSDVATRAEGKSRRCVGHYVEFKHTVDGVPVDSPGGGDAIKVRVDNSGAVRAYGRVWRTVQGSTGAARRPVLGAREALASGLKMGGWAGSKTRIGGTVRLKEARMVYLSGSRDADVSVLRPAWRYVLESDSGNHKMYVDAESGQAILEDR